MNPPAVVTTAPPSLHAELARLEAAATQLDVAYLGRRVRWRCWGDGPPLVLIHGGHGSWMHWVRNIEVLAETHSVWVPDLPGFGDSEEVAREPSSPDPLGYLLDALSATLDTLVGARASVDMVGFSFGGLVAAELRVRRGDVRRLALIGTAGHGGRRRQPVELVKWRSADRVQMLQALRHNLTALMLHDASRVDALAMAVHEASCLQTRFRSKAISRTAGRLQAALNGSTRPVLLIWGEHDVTAVPHDIAPGLAEGGLAREWCVVPRGGHWVQYESADEVNKVLSAWLSLGEEISDESSGPG